jgi:hypothetical protein
MNVLVLLPIRKNPSPLTGVRLSRSATPLVPQLAGARAHLGQHPRYSGCGDRVEVRLQILLQVGMLGRRCDGNGGR